MFEETLALPNLYSICGFIISILYIPQLNKVLKAENSLKDISILTWTVWAVCLFISFLYAYEIAKDLKIAIVNLIGAFFCLLISTATIYKRQKYKAKIIYRIS